MKPANPFKKKGYEVIIMEKKITKKEMFAELKEIVEGMDRADLVAFVEHEIELLNKKASNKAQTKTQKENEVLVERLYDVLKEIGKAVTITEIQNASDEFKDLSNQKVSALMTKLVKAERVVKVSEKNKSYFSVAEQLNGGL